jgi:hypothetical protein
MAAMTGTPASTANIRGEVRIFSTKDNESFERTYGWAWLLQLQDELLSWDDPLGRELSSNVAPLAHRISRLFIAYLPRMNYPVRVGEHTNLAFALRLAWDYAARTNDDSQKTIILRTAIRFFKMIPITPYPGNLAVMTFLVPHSKRPISCGASFPHPHTIPGWLNSFLP